MDLKEIAEAYQLVYEKKKLDPVGKEDDDVDNDGKVNSSDEYLKKRRAAIGDAMGKDGDKEEEEEKKSVCRLLLHLFPRWVETFYLFLSR